MQNITLDTNWICPSHTEDMEAPSARSCFHLTQHRQLWLTPALLRMVQNEEILQHGKVRMLKAAAATARVSLGVKAGAGEESPS